MREFFPERYKLKIMFKGPLKNNSQETFYFKSLKELQVKKELYKLTYKPEAIEFREVLGRILIHDKPVELSTQGFLKIKASSLFFDVPKWINNSDTIWGQGFEHTWYVAKADFSEIIKLKNK